MLYRILFLLIVLAYCLYYAPFGINETDGGFLTALAWQLENGKTLYRDVVYVRPPLPVWERYLELQVMPDHWAILGERWLFYFKLALYSWLGAAVLSTGTQRSLLAIAGFLVSAHCYPAAAWHTVDGILWAVLAVWLWNRKGTRTDVAAGAALGAALMCKQSFYPLILLFPLILYGEQGRRWLFSGLGLLAVLAAVSGVLITGGAWTDFWTQTTGAASSGQLLQHGLIDYFRLNPYAVLPAGILMLPVAHRLWGRRQNSRSPAPLVLYTLALLWLAGVYAWSIQSRQEFTLPYPQIRFLFWLSAGHLLLDRGRWKTPWSTIRPQVQLLLIAWASSLSWGYNLPILFAIPMLWTVFLVAGKLWDSAAAGRSPDRFRPWMTWSALILLMGLFRFGYEFVYRDGRRAQMSAALSEVFPRLQGIYSTPGKKALYEDLYRLSGRYPAFKTLPSFPPASYLCQTLPPLPLDWVVEREMGPAKSKVVSTVQDTRPVWFVEKVYSDRLATDPQLSFTQEILEKGRILEETPHFWVVFSEKE